MKTKEDIIAFFDKCNKTQPIGFKKYVASEEFKKYLSALNDIDSGIGEDVFKTSGLRWMREMHEHAMLANVMLKSCKEAHKKTVGEVEKLTELQVANVLQLVAELEGIRSKINENSGQGKIEKANKDAAIKKAEYEQSVSDIASAIYNYKMSMRSLEFTRKKIEDEFTDTQMSVRTETVS